MGLVVVEVVVAAGVVVDGVLLQMLPERESLDFVLWAPRGAKV